MTNKKKEKKQCLYYHKTKICFSYPVPIRSGCCNACKQCKSKNEIKQTALHHAKYAYQTETVKKNPVLALDNTMELCFFCHQIADGFRGILVTSSGGRKSVNRILQVAKLLPKDHKEYLTEFCRKWLKTVKK